MNIPNKFHLLINDEVLKTVEALSSRGLTQKQIGMYFGVCESTIKRRFNDTPGMREHYDQGKAKRIYHVSGKLMERIDAGDISAIIFYLKTQAGWKDGSERTIESAPNVQLTMTTTDPNEAAKIYQDIMKGSAPDERNSSGE
jgi:hypothetical protein